MKTTVITPTLTPRIVSDERNLFARTVSNAMKADSRTSPKFITHPSTPRWDPAAPPATPATDRSRRPQLKTLQHRESPTTHLLAGEIRSPALSARLFRIPSALQTRRR